MSSASLSRLSGIVLLVGSLLSFVSATVLDVQFPGRNATPQQILSLPWILETSLILVGVLLITLGFPGFYLCQSAKAGKLGFAGFVILWVAVLLSELSFTALQITIFPWLSQTDPKLLGSGAMPFAAALLFVFGPTLLFIVGSILLGIATMRSGVFGRWPGIALLALGIIGVMSVLLMSVPLPSTADNIVNTLFDVSVFLAFAWCGYAAVARKVEPTAAPSMVIPSVQTSR